jgi:uncharacterized protein YbaA (DUF1428 family)
MPGFRFRRVQACPRHNPTRTGPALAVKRKDDEAVVFSWILWPSRTVRDEGMKTAMADPRLQPDKNLCLLTANV